MTNRVGQVGEDRRRSGLATSARRTAVGSRWSRVSTTQTSRGLPAESVRTDGRFVVPPNLAKPETSCESMPFKGDAEGLEPLAPRLPVPFGESGLPEFALSRPNSAVLHGSQLVDRRRLAMAVSGRLRTSCGLSADCTTTCGGYAARRSQSCAPHEPTRCMDKCKTLAYSQVQCASRGRRRTRTTSRRARGGIRERWTSTSSGLARCSQTLGWLRSFPIRGLGWVRQRSSDGHPAARPAGAGVSRSRRRFARP